MKKNYSALIFWVLLTAVILIAASVLLKDMDCLLYTSRSVDFCGKYQTKIRRRHALCYVLRGRVVFDDGKLRHVFCDFCFLLCNSYIL